LADPAPAGHQAKKKTQRAAEQERPEVQAEREAFQQRIEQVEPARLFYVDEFGFHLNMTRTYARAPSSERARAAVPFNPGPAITLVMALGLLGVVAPCAFQGAMNGHVFGLYMAEQVIPQLPPDAVIVVDNLPAHHSEDAREALEAHGLVVVDPEDDEDVDVVDALNKPSVQVWFMPPYSPELSAVEECGSKVKALVRGAEPRSVSDLIAAMGDAIGKVTPSDARGWFRDARHARASRPSQRDVTSQGAEFSQAASRKEDTG
jgi:transposase